MKRKLPLLMSFFTFILTCQAALALDITKSEAREFCSHWFKALSLSTKDINVVLPHLLNNYYTEDIVFIDPNFQLPQVGHGALGTYYKLVLTKYPHWIFEIEEIYITEAGFILHYIGKVPGKVEFFRGIDILELSKSNTVAKFKINKLTGIYDRTPFIEAEKE